MILALSQCTSYIGRANRLDNNDFHEKARVWWIPGGGLTSLGTLVLWGLVLSLPGGQDAGEDREGSPHGLSLDDVKAMLPSNNVRRTSPAAWFQDYVALPAAPRPEGLG